MLCKRIIPCLDLKDGRVVKGVNFVSLRDAGDPVEAAKTYNAAGADEIVFLDITASADGRKTKLDVISRASEQVFIPLTVGGGISSVEDFSVLLKCGADKIAVNSAAIDNPGLILNAALKFGSQCVVLSLDVKRVDKGFRLFAKGGRVDTGLDAVEFAANGVKAGAGEIVLNSIDTDGVKNGFDLEMLKVFCDAVNVPVIASGGAGKAEDFIRLFQIKGVDAGLAASIFHFKEVDIRDLKKLLSENGVPVRLV